jgi:hypothetical protein
VVSLIPKEEGTILLSRATRSLQMLVVWLSPGSQPQFVDWRDQARLREPLATLVIMWAAIVPENKGSGCYSG